MLKSDLHYFSLKLNCILTFYLQFSPVYFQVYLLYLFAIYSCLNLFSILSSISTHRISCRHIFTQISQNLFICSIQFDLFAAFSTWLPISKCSLSCGGGVTTEIRSCDVLGFCQGPTLMNVTCNTHPCPGMT